VAENKALTVVLLDGVLACCFLGTQAEGVPYYMMRELAALKVRKTFFHASGL
jgi:hypothetical protein